MPKCASTTLQYQFFSTCSKNYFGRKKNSKENANHIGYYVQSMSHNYRSQKFENKSELVNFFQVFHELSSENPEDCVILSEEVLTCPDFFEVKNFLNTWQLYAVEQRQCIANLIMSKKNNMWEYGQIKILLIIRKQSDFLPSLYSEFSRFMINPSTADFERRTQFILNNQIHRQLDYFSLYYDLKDVFGSNLCVLCLEEINDPKFWKKMIDFLGLSNMSADGFVKDLSRDNEKKIGDRTYRIPELDLKCARTAFRRDKANAQLLLLNFSSYYRRLISKKREKKFHINKDLENQISEKYSLYNKKFAAIADSDLEEFGYF